jgi:hypothetical protein
VPVLIFKPATHPAANDSASGASKGAASLPVVTIADSAGNVSKLDVFSEKNPFKPLQDVDKKDTGVPGGSSTGSSSGSSGSGGTGGSGGAGGTGGSGSGTTGGTSTTTTDRKYYAFHIDVRFGPRGDEKSYKDVKQLGMLPDSDNPVVVFMGMSADFKTAVFLVDTSKYEAAGEGKCEPSPETCSFVKLSMRDSGNEETLAATDGSVDYTLKLTKIERVFLTPEEARGDSKDQSTPKAKAARVDRSRDKGERPGLLNPLSELFELPAFASQG